MDITLKIEILESLTYRGVLAYVASAALGDGKWKTAVLAGAVACNTSLMLEGMGELVAAAPTFAAKGPKGTWVVGAGVASTEAIQILDSEQARRTEFLNDMKSIFEWANKAANLKFSMGAADGAAVQRWLKQNKDWTQEQWRTAMRNRFLSEGIIKSQPIYIWLGRLIEYVEHPKDRFGKSMPLGVGGKVGQAIGVEQSNREAREAAVAAAGSQS